MTTPPLKQNDYIGLQPPGSLNPPQHVFPTDHLYFYLTNTAVEVPGYAPADFTITMVYRDVHNVGTLNESLDYDLQLGEDNY